MPPNAPDCPEETGHCGHHASDCSSTREHACFRQYSMPLHGGASNIVAESPLPSRACFVSRLTNRWSCSTRFLRRGPVASQVGREATELWVRSAHDGPHVPSTDVENGPGAKASGCEIQDGLRHFYWLAQPGQRYPSLRKLPLLRTLEIGA